MSTRESLVRTVPKDNNAKGIVFRKHLNNREAFSGGWKTSKINLKPNEWLKIEKIVFGDFFLATWCRQIKNLMVVGS